MFGKCWLFIFLKHSLKILQGIDIEFEAVPWILIK